MLGSGCRDRRSTHHTTERQQKMCRMAGVLTKSEMVYEALTLASSLSMLDSRICGQRQG